MRKGTKRDVPRPRHFAIRAPFADQVRPWAIGNGPTTRFLTVTPTMAPQSACRPTTLGTVPAEICMFRRSVISTSGRPTVSVFERGATPPAAGCRAPTPCRCWPLPRRRSPSLVRAPCIRRTTADRSTAGHRGDSVQFRRCPSPRTPRCPQPFEMPPTRPALLRARSGSAFGSTHEGGATPPAVENVDPSLVDVCPLRGRRSPLAAVRSWRVVRRDLEREDVTPL